MTRTKVLASYVWELLSLTSFGFFMVGIFFHNSVMYFLPFENPVLTFLLIIYNVESNLNRMIKTN